MTHDKHCEMTKGLDADCHCACRAVVLPPPSLTRFFALYLKSVHAQHGERGACAFEGCETEPCPALRAVISSAATDEEVPAPPSGPDPTEEDRLRARVAELTEIFSVVAVENQSETRLKLETAKAVCGAVRGMVDAFEQRLDEALRVTGGLSG